MSQQIIRDRIPGAELLSAHHPACPGCGETLALRLVLKALGPDTILVRLGGRGAIHAGLLAAENLAVPVAGALPGSEGDGNAPAGAESHEGRTVVAWTDDPELVAGGLPAVAEPGGPGGDVLYVLCDVVADFDSGLPLPALESPADWAATAAVSWPDDLVRKARHARSLTGVRLLHILAPCPATWQIPPDRTIELGRLAVHSRLFPLFEVTGGSPPSLSLDHHDEPVASCLGKQGRYRDLADARVADIQSAVDTRWERLIQAITDPQ